MVVENANPIKSISDMYLFILKSTHHPTNKKPHECVYENLSFCSLIAKGTEGHNTERIRLNNYCLLWFKIIESIFAFIFFSLLIFSIISRAFSSGFRFSKLSG